jgi:hypothetical protein
LVVKSKQNKYSVFGGAMESKLQPTDRVILAVIRSDAEMVLSLKVQFGVISLNLNKEVQYVDISGLNLEQGLTATINAAVAVGTNCIMVEALSSIYKTAKESAQFAMAVFDCGKRLFSYSCAEFGPHLVEIDCGAVDKLLQTIDDDLLTIDMDDLSIVLSYFSKAITIDTLIAWTFDKVSEKGGTAYNREL